MIELHLSEAEIEKERGYYERLYKTKALACPLCKSEQVQLCLNYNNPIHDVAKCRDCKCQAPLSAWNNRKKE